jgi:hypothetical protein
MATQPYKDFYASKDFAEFSKKFKAARIVPPPPIAVA